MDFDTLTATTAKAVVVTRYVSDGWNLSKPTPVGNENFGVYAHLDSSNLLLAFG